MANKRDFKKAIRFACGGIVGECINASDLFPGTKVEEWDQVIINTALLQRESERNVGVKFDKKPNEFENRKAYKQARRKFYKDLEKAISDNFKTQVEDIVKQMNALVPKK